MSNLVLIDTSAWILALRPGNARVTERIDRLLAEDRGATTGIVILELLGGTKTLREFKELEKDMKSLHYFFTTEALWLKSSRLAFTLRKKGITVPATDVLVASLAVENGCLLFHVDSHFDLVAKHSNLEAENLLVY